MTLYSEVTEITALRFWTHWLGVTMMMAMMTRPKMSRMTRIEMTMPRQFLPSPSSAANSLHRNTTTYFLRSPETGPTVKTQ